MKSKSLKVLVKGLIVAGAAFALAACDDSVNSPVSAETSAADQQVQPVDPVVRNAWRYVHGLYSGLYR